MSTTPNPRGRRSLRDSEVSETFTPIADTTLTGLQRLPIHTKYPLTPSRLSSATPSRRTPRNRGAAAPSTPHGLRAMQRRAANTPARDRRKSGRMQRETTFDILRNLGRALAPVSQPIGSSPQEEKPEPEPEPKRDEIDELDNEPEIERPRLSLPLEEVEEQYEASPEPRPPRLSLAFEEEDITVEYPRRATSEHDRARLSMMSFGNPRLSENFGDATRLESDSEDDETGIEHDDNRENPDETVMSQGAFDRGGDTEDLGRFNFDFNFPSPPPPPANNMDEPLNDDEGFELPPVDLAQDTAPMSDDSDDAGITAGDFGLDLNLPSRASLSESPGIIGGGLHDEDTVIVQGKQKKLSRHGIPIPNMPSGVIKKLATRFAPARAGSKAKISKATLTAIEQATSWYFEQVAEDLAAYSTHAGRKTIDESDVTTLMRRQRHLNNSTTIFSLASKHLPKELLQDMRLSMPP
ncbi:uncharacterized protein BDW43DRAFT_266119 [Aspergillus alliaceus]|uniref:uncharacterized protein n=1 Tax=Petromyces alliaceus TaxID=209559 RepID=UPI0012A3BE0C|nr:centromere kinetochore component CENP-T-domain-containing protein [Aspergillus alliaceus]KAB8236813.1 centromere kinetochore component CENP-T-domain-containing protein [Aspergillus alliaceus]